MDNKINANETIIEGGIVIRNNKSYFDDSSLRIVDLIETFLIKINCDKMGWEILYQNPIDKLFWELTYPNSQVQAGGAPTLKKIDVNLPIYIEKYLY